MNEINTKYWLCCGSLDSSHISRGQPDCFDTKKAKFGTLEDHRDALADGQAQQDADKVDAQPTIRKDVKAVLLSLDVPIYGYMASHSQTLHKTSKEIAGFESAIPLVSQTAHRRACDQIAALIPEQFKGKNCGATDGVSHSSECRAEHGDAIGYVEAKPDPSMAGDEARKLIGRSISDFMFFYESEGGAGQCDLDWCDSANVDALVDVIYAHFRIIQPSIGCDDFLIIKQLSERNASLDARCAELERENDALRVQPASGKHVDIVFSGEMPDLVFVEAEDHDCKSIEFGQWIKRDDGYTVIRVAGSVEGPLPERATILNAPATLNAQHKAIWVMGWNNCLSSMQQEDQP